MGNKIQNHSFRLNEGYQFHPVEGRVQTVYSDVGKRTLMRIEKSLDKQQIEFYEHMSAQNTQGLARCRGLMPQNGCGFQQCGNTAWVLWDFYGQQRLKKSCKKDIAIQMLEISLTASRILHPLGLFVEYSPSLFICNDQGSLELYWGSISARNSHRSFEKCLYTGKTINGVFSPEELKQLKTQMLAPMLLKNLNIDRSKCQTYSLGITILSTLIGKSPSDFYSIQKLELREDRINSSLKWIEKHQRFSCFALLLPKLLQKKSNKRAQSSQISKFLETCMPSMSYVSLEDQITAETWFAQPERREAKISLRM